MDALRDRDREIVAEFKGAALEHLMLEHPF
jgi:hypothetical protein